MLTENKITEIFFIVASSAKFLTQCCAAVGLSRTTSYANATTTGKAVDAYGNNHDTDNVPLRLPQVPQAFLPRTRLRPLPSPVPRSGVLHRFVELEKTVAVYLASWCLSRNACWQVHRYQLCRQHPAVGVPQPTHIQPPRVQILGT